MCKSNLKFIGKLILTGSVILNGYLLLGIWVGLPRTHNLDRELIGSWKSSDPQGFRLVMVYTGEFILLKNGRSEWPVGRWSAREGELYIQWAVDIENPLFNFRTNKETAKYKLSIDGNELTIDSSSLDISPTNVFRRVRSDI